MKIKWGALVTDGRNKIGGHVASKNRAGAYLRTKVTPVNPQTAFQSAIRAIFTALSQAWRSLTQAQRDAWNAAVSNFSTTDIFGDLKTPTGKNLYQRLNQNLDLVGVAAISTPPLPEGAGSVDTVTPTASEGGQTLSIVYAPTPVPADRAYIVEVTPQVSAGREFVKNEYRFLAYIDAAAASPYAAGAAYVARFGALVQGLKIGVRMTPVNKLTGERGQPLQALIIVGA